MDPQQTRQRLYQKVRREKFTHFPLHMLLRLSHKIAKTRGTKAECDWFSRMIAPKIREARKQSDRAFDNYAPKKNDVFICSYIKSGTYWAIQIAYQIAALGEGDYEHIHDKVPWPDWLEGYAVDLDSKLPEQNASGIRVIKTHNHADNVPYSSAAKYICVVRDPKDVFVSSYHFFKCSMFGKLMPSIPSWLEIFLSPYNIGGDWATFTNSYWAWRKRSNVLFLTFEEIKEDLPKTIQKIANLLEVELTTKQFNQVGHLSSYQYMKTINHKFYPGQVTPFAQKEGIIIRRGKKNVSGELIHAVDQKRIDDFMLDGLKKQQSDFPYTQMYGSINEENQTT